MEFRSLQKKSKKARYEREKVYMETLRSIGCGIGEYVGDGQGESEAATPAPMSIDAGLIDTEPGDVSLNSEGDMEEDDSRDAQPLLTFYDCETTGFSIYNDHITDIAAKVVASPVPLTDPTFSSLIRTSKRIPAVGKKVTSFC